MKKNKIGAHVSIEGGLLEAPKRAKAWECECYNFFTRSPHGGKVSDITYQMAAEFRELNKKYGFDRIYVHSPYFINLASINNRVYHGSISALRQELERCSLLGVTGLMTHIGSAMGQDYDEAIKLVVRAIVEILKGYVGSTQFLLEVSAGAGQIIGSKIGEIGKIIKEVEKKDKKHKVGVCLDTAHLFASGYELRTRQGIRKLSEEIKKSFGWDRVKLVHSNDSERGLGERKDRHAHIGKGRIGLEGFRLIMSDSNFKKLDFVLETPEEAGRVADIRVLKKIRDGIL